MKKREKIELTTKPKNKGIFSLIVKIIAILLLLALNIYLVIDLLNKKELVNDSEEVKVVNKQEKNKDIKEDIWRDGDKSLVFNEDLSCSYYDAKNRYYYGTYEYKTGAQALEEMGYTEEDLKSQFGDSINPDNVYSIQMTPTARVIDGIDKSNVIKKNTKWWIILIIKDEHNAIAYNKTLDERYELIKD